MSKSLIRKSSTAGNKGGLKHRNVDRLPHVQRLRYLNQVIPQLLKQLKFPTYLSHAIASHQDPVLPVDLLFLTAGDASAPPDMFWRLRWGGQVVFICRDRKLTAQVEAQYQKQASGFQVTHSTSPLKIPQRFWRWPWPAPRHYWMAATKTLLVPPGQSSERFTYHLELVQQPDQPEGWIVRKQVPPLELVISRLRHKFPEAPQSELERRARKFTEKIFPLFLTRESVFLNLLSERLPQQFKNRVPHVLRCEKNAQGMVEMLEVNWLRNATPADAQVHSPGQRAKISQLQFARQAGDLLQALHDVARVIHLDLRLDNVVITHHGVGFVDFGSAVRVGEALDKSPLLTTLFGEMMRTSQIQRMLGKMQDLGQVTSEPLCNSYHKVDKGVDLFYYAMQINHPLANPDFIDLVDYQPGSGEAEKIAQLTDQILRPKDPAQPFFRTISDILRALSAI